MELKYKNKKFSAEFIDKKNGLAALMLDNVETDITFRRNGNDSISFKIGDTSHIAYTAEDEHRLYTCIDGNYFTFDKIHPEEKQYGFEEITDSNSDVIHPPMPGCVVKILVEKEQKVNEGDGLIIIEAMKMETTLYSTIEGIVTQINVSQGEQVDSDKVLLVVEKVQA